MYDDGNRSVVYRSSHEYWFVIVVNYQGILRDDGTVSTSYGIATQLDLSYTKSAINNP